MLRKSAVLRYENLLHLILRKIAASKLPITHFRYTVTMHDIAIDSARGIDQSLINEVNTCSYIDHGYPILITGPTGTGKSWLASALGHHACLCGYKVRYFNIMKLFEELTLARVEARLTKVFERIAQTDLLILDDFGIKKFNSDQVLDLMEIIEDRHNRKATIIASQLPVRTGMTSSMQIVRQLMPY